MAKRPKSQRRAQINGGWGGGGQRYFLSLINGGGGRNFKISVNIGNE